jgi:cyclase
MRKLCFGVILLASGTAFAQDKPDFAKLDVKITKVAGQVYIIEGTGKEFTGGNIGVSIGADGVVLVDSKFAPLAPKIEAALKTVSDKPIRFVVNTHFHGDHTDGNSVFGMKSTIIAHENTRKRMMAGRGADSPPAPAVALPVVTFEDKISVHLNGEDIRATHFPSAHTDTDVVVFFPQSNVLHMGDEFFNGVFPFIDTEGGGSAKGLIANIEKILPTLSADVKIIPGHGPLATVKDLRAFLDMLKDSVRIVETGIKSKKSLDQLKKDKVLDKYASWSWLIDANGYMEMLYKDLTTKRG